MIGEESNLNMECMTSSIENIYNISSDAIPKIYEFLKKDERKILEFYFETLCNCMVLDELLHNNGEKLNVDVFASAQVAATHLKNDIGKEIVFGKYRGCIRTIGKLYKKQNSQKKNAEIKKEINDILVSVFFCVRKIEHIKLLAGMSTECKDFLNENIKIKTRLENIRKNCIDIKTAFGNIYEDKPQNK